jgi:hypothetical protein
MMTPEEVQRTMEFILWSQADSVIRMDRLEENLDRLGENLDVLLSASHDLLRVSKIHNERLKRLESKGKK